MQARSSGGERYPDTVEVRGSNPRVPTIISISYGDLLGARFHFVPNF